MVHFSQIFTHSKPFNLLLVLLFSISSLIVRVEGGDGVVGLCQFSEISQKSFEKYFLPKLNFFGYWGQNWDVCGLKDGVKIPQNNSA